MKEIEGKVDQDIKEEVKSEMFLSSEMNQEIIKNFHEIKQQEDENENSCLSPKINRIFTFFFYTIISFILFSLSLVILIVVMLAFSIISLVKKECSNFFLSINILICMTSTAYSFVVFFFFENENEYISLLIQDSVSFVASSFLVFSFIKTSLDSYNNRLTLYSQFKVINNIGQDPIINTLQYINNKREDSKGHLFDYFSKYLQIDLSIYPKVSTKFKLLSITGKSIEREISFFFEDFSDYIKPNFQNFFYLVLIILIKLAFVSYYIYLKSKTLNSREIFDMSVVIFVFLYCAFNINRILGNNDLKRKQQFMVKINKFIDFEDINKENYPTKLDITCPVSLECWDNSRKIVLTEQKELLQDLELSYFCFMFYYLFMILICASFYFDLDWIIPKDSHLMNPLIIIISTFNFVFLTTFLVFRFKEGDAFNETFEDIEYTISCNQDMISDLMTMYAEFFEKNEKYEELRYTRYGILIKKIKLLSKEYIKKQQPYNQVVYTLSQKNILRKQILNDVSISLAKIKQSIQTDNKQFSYKFMNLVEVKLNDFLFTLGIAMISFLPTIVPKFISFFVQKQ